MSDNTEQGIVFDSIKIGLASPEKILQWSHGEVKKPETIVVNIRELDTRALFVSVVALK